MTTEEHPHIGSSLDDLLTEDGTLDTVTERVLERVRAFHQFEESRNGPAAPVLS